MDEVDKLKPEDAKLVASGMMLIAVFVPFIFTITPVADSFSLMASAWMFFFEGAIGYSLFFGPMEWAAMSPLTLWRLVYVFQIFRYYRGKSTRRRTMLVGILIESPLLLAFIVFALPSLGITTSVPLPFLLIAGTLLVWRYPRLEPETLWEGQKETWW